jgi:hypothetical protein
VKAKRSRNRRRRDARDKAANNGGALPSVTPNYRVRCMVCGAVPTMGEMRMCGPCTFGDSSTAGGNW